MYVLIYYYPKFFKFGLFFGVAFKSPFPYPCRVDSIDLFNNGLKSVFWLFGISNCLTIIVYCSFISLLLTLSLRHSPIVGSCTVITLLITMLWALRIVERSAREKTQTSFRIVPRHSLLDHN